MTFLAPSLRAASAIITNELHPLEEGSVSTPMGCRPRGFCHRQRGAPALGDRENAKVLATELGIPQKMRED